MAFTGAVEEEGAATTATALARVLVLVLVVLVVLLLLLLLLLPPLLPDVLARLVMASAFLFEPVAADARRALTTLVLVEAGMRFGDSLGKGLALVVHCEGRVRAGCHKNNNKNAMQQKLTTNELACRERVQQ